MIRSRFVSLLAFVVLACFFGAPRVHAQGLTSQISGIVTDAGGGVIPGATVVVKNVGTNLVRETVTGPDGTFVITNLLRGTFDLAEELKGETLVVIPDWSPRRSPTTSPFSFLRALVVRERPA